jgi:hypothetical protein
LLEKQFSISSSFEREKLEFNQEMHTDLNHHYLCVVVVVVFSFVVVVDNVASAI